MTQIRTRDEISEFARLVGDWRSMAIVHAVYEHRSLRYVQLERILAFSPTLLSQKLRQLTYSGVITRQKTDGAKEVQYAPTPLAEDIVHAYHLLEDVSNKLAEAQRQHIKEEE